MKFEIWSEGFRITGNEGNAHLHGTSEGETFKEAVNNYAQQDVYFRAYFDEEHMTFWGCRLFDNETDARRSFG